MPQIYSNMVWLDLLTLEIFSNFNQSMINWVPTRDLEFFLAIIPSPQSGVRGAVPILPIPQLMVPGQSRAGEERPGHPGAAALPHSPEQPSTGDAPGQNAPGHVHPKGIHLAHWRLLQAEQSAAPDPGKANPRCPLARSCRRSHCTPDLSSSCLQATFKEQKYSHLLITAATAPFIAAGRREWDLGRALLCGSPAPRRGKAERSDSNAQATRKNPGLSCIPDCSGQPHLLKNSGCSLNINN